MSEQTLKNNTLNKTTESSSTNKESATIPNSRFNTENKSSNPYNKKRKENPFTKKYKSEFEEKIISTKRISKTTKGGRQSRMWVMVVVGNRKGQVGFGIGKSKEFPEASKKALKNAIKSVVKIKINNKGTVYHEVHGKFGASKVLIKSAKTGTGIIAGGAIKTVLELAGFNDVYSKSLGSNVPMNTAQATINALLDQRTPKEIADLRDKSVWELFK